MRYLVKELVKKGADDVVVSSYDSRKTQIKFVNNEIAITKQWNTLSLDVFMNYKKRIVATSLRDYDKKSASTLVNNVITFAKAARENKDYKGIAKGPFKYKALKDYYDPEIKDLGEKGIDFVEAGINAALAAGAKRANGVLEYEDFNASLLSSDKAEGKDKGTSIYYSIRTHATKEASGYASYSGRILSRFKPEEKGKMAGAVAKLGLKPQKVSAKKYHVAFSPYAFATLLNRVADALSIFSVESGDSFFMNRLGKKVANPCITMYDDGTFPEGLNTMKFDNEGVPQRKTLTIDKGILKTYLHNTSTAKRYKVKTTANAGLIFPSPTNTVLAPGKAKKGTLQNEFTGLYITNLWYTRFQNYLTGDFSTIPRDAIFLFKNGDMVKPVKDIRITENILNLLKNVQAHTKEQQQNYGWEVDTPVICGHALVKDMNITRSKD